ncbi:hypothetical protein ANCDUO_14787 [Ancylostoma duodenale]|uniref:DUF5641 domain-containing protein n=1 Tax=Ancylostoma duodenale TaxID=51022 RepID=A0A0C2CZ01_9BILA|nr:hypothetical protein ANCDUO_14787 [Ancylostoma duodenale]
MDDTQPRGEWKLGLITELIKDTDGIVRSVKLKTSKSVLERSINMLIPLELDEEDSDNKENTNNEKTSVDASATSKSSDNDTDTTRKEVEVNDPSASIEHQRPLNCNRIRESMHRQRPYLPRKAKHDQHYTAPIATRDLAHAMPRIQWHYWLSIKLNA